MARASSTADGAAVSTLSGRPFPYPGSAFRVEPGGPFVATQRAGASARRVVRIRKGGGAVAARPCDPGDDSRHHECREAEPERRTGERPGTGVGVAGLG